MIKAGNVWYPLWQKKQADEALFWIHLANITTKQKNRRYGKKRQQYQDRTQSVSKKEQAGSPSTSKKTWT